VRPGPLILRIIHQRPPPQTAGNALATAIIDGQSIPDDSLAVSGIIRLTASALQRAAFFGVHRQGAADHLENPEILPILKTIDLNTDSTGLA
jgi:hypothetical protein